MVNSGASFMLTVGTVVDRYTIQDVLGTGGMALVYKAVHNELQSTHAIKILRVPSATVRERLLKEGRVQAKLSHPNIVGVTDVLNVGGALGLVMEFVDGPSLDQLLRREHLSIEQIDHLAAGVIRGVAAAHRFGTVHRDLKPANIMLAIRDGALIPKITDFGLVKILNTETDGQLSRTGFGMGTPSYMAPEQIENAKGVDERADVFSLGAVLYEMVCGKRAFHGDSMLAILRKIDDGLYMPLRQLRPELPNRIEDAVDGALIRDRDQRIPNCDSLLQVWQGDEQERLTVSSQPWSKEHLKRARNIAKMATEEERSKATYEALSLMGTTTAAITPPTELKTTEPNIPHRPFPTWGLAVLVMALIFVSTIAVVIQYKNAQDTGTEVEGTARKKARFKKLTFSEDVELYPTLSPDGRQVVYVDDQRHIQLLRLGGSKPLDLTGPEGGLTTQPAFSPKGESIAYVRTDAPNRGIWIMGATGESPRRLLNGGFHPAWSPDGKSIAFCTANVYNPLVRGKSGQLYVVDVASKGMTLASEEDAVQPTWSPGGTRIAFWRFASGDRELWTVRPDGTEAVRVETGAKTHWSPVWTEEGLLYLSDDDGITDAWRVVVDEETGAVVQAPEAITSGVAQAVWHLHATQDAQRMVYVTLTTRSRIIQFSFDAESKRMPGSGKEITRGRHFERPDFSPDGRRLAFMSFGEQEDLFIVRTDGTGLRQITNDVHRDRSPRWSHDGKRIAFFSNRDGTYGIYSINPDGGDLVKHSPEGEYVNPVWSPDGKQIIGHSNRIPWLIDLKDPESPELLSERQITMHSWSPNGRYLAGWIDGQGVYRLDVKTGRLTKLTDFPALPRWLSDSRRLLLATNTELGLFDPDGEPQWTDLLTMVEPDSIAGLALSSDNKEIVLGVTSREGDLWALMVKD
ncbi:MAG: serine/threonine-protein kinase [Proteobacteria bacterium]|nr:serine/threonine-protein kinase [Pseudomonadota bacterium]